MRHQAWPHWPRALTALTTLVVGLGLWVGILTCLSLIHALTQETILAIAFIFLWFGRNTLLANWNRLSTLISSARPLDPSARWLIALLLTLTAIHCLEALRPAPTGFDDTTYYFSQVKLMTETNQLSSAGWPASFEILATGIQLASGAANYFPALSLGLYGLLLGGLLLFSMAHQYFGLRAGLWSALIFLSLPMAAALALFETKPDSLLFPVLTLAFWLLIEGYRHTKYQYTLASFLCLGLALSIKLTACFFLPAFVLIGFITLHRSSSPLKTYLIRTSLLLAFLLIPLLPWISLKLAVTLVPLQSATPTLAQDLNTLTRDASCVPTGQLEDFARFAAADQSVFTELLFLPWDITLNTRTGLFATEIGFLFLAFAPLLLLAWLTAKEAPGPPSFMFPVISLALSGFSAWVILGERVPWYFYPALAPLLLLIVFTHHEWQRHQALAWGVTSLLVIGILSQSLIRQSFAGDIPDLRYILETTPANDYLDQTMPGAHRVWAILNQSTQERLFMTGTRLWYGIEAAGERAVMDQQLDTFACVVKRFGFAGAAQQFRILGIRYFFFNKSLIHELDHPTRPTLTAKVKLYTDFATEYLRPVWGSAAYMILEFAPNK